MRFVRSRCAPSCHSTREGRLWNEFVARYHYLGYKTLVGAQMRYAVHDRNGWTVAMLGFSTAAWKLAPRDNFIAWTPELREKNLPLVVDNPRFLILPWIEIPNLGSHILAIVRRRLPGDWTERYGIHPRAHRDLSSRPRDTPAPSTARRAGPASGPPRAGAATTGTRNELSRKGTSGSARSEEIGGAPSIGRITPGRGRMRVSISSSPGTRTVTDGFDKEAQGWSGTARRIEAQSLPNRLRTWK